MSLEKTAFQSIDALLEELTVGIVAKEQEILRIQPRGGITMARLIEEYENRLKTLADHCAAQRSWVNKNSVFPAGRVEHGGERSQTRAWSSFTQLFADASKALATRRVSATPQWLINVRACSVTATK